MGVLGGIWLSTRHSPATRLDPPEEAHHTELPTEWEHGRNPHQETNLILQDDGETVTQRVTLAEENEAAKPTDETLSQRVITFDDDYAPLRWTIKQDIPYISIYSHKSPKIDLGDWVDADLLETAQASSSVYTWDSPVLFQVLRELRQMREACR